jgi:hypothetical protein
MDPYLENPNQWESFHGCLISVLHEMLRARVQPHFLVHQQAAVYLIEPGDDPRARPPIRPDVYVIAPEMSPEPPVEIAGGARTLVAERTITEPKLLDVRYPEEIRQRYLEVLDRESRAVVATIEVVSPTNKDRRGGGLEQFDRKRRDMMASPVHWLEIDLLRAGERPIEVSGDITRQGDYVTLLKRGHGSPMPSYAPRLPFGDMLLEAWFWDVRDAMPVVALPLRPPFPDVGLDLQAALQTVYARYYDGDINYASPPYTPLPPADAAWAEERVRAWRAQRSSEAGG